MIRNNKSNKKYIKTNSNKIQNKKHHILKDTNNNKDNKITKFCDEMPYAKSKVNNKVNKQKKKKKIKKRKKRMEKKI